MAPRELHPLAIGARSQAVGLGMMPFSLSLVAFTNTMTFIAFSWI
jgi:hypothetical protein